MKNIILLVLLMSTIIIHAQNNVGIGTNTPHNSAKLEISDSTKGILIPRMNSIQRNAIVSPANGLLVYDNDSLAFMYFNGSIWKKIATSFTLTESDPQVSSTSSNQIPKWNGTTLVDGIITDDGTKLGIGTTTPDIDTKVDILSDKPAGIRLLSGNTANTTYFTFGRVTQEGVLGTASHPNNYVTGSQAGDIVLREENSTNAVIINSGYGNADLIVKGDNVGIGTVSPSNTLDVAGTTETDLFKMNTGAGVGKILQSDASGNASWVNPPSNTDNDSQSLSLSGSNLSISRGNTIDMSPLIANAWKTTGNASTNAATNFIGTTDNVDLVFKNNNNQNMRLFANGSWLIGDSMQSAGVRTFFDITKKAFRTGEISSFYSRFWNSDSIGNNSFATGLNTKAKGNNSNALGNHTAAIGDASTAMGHGAAANGETSTAFGDFTEANGETSTAMGNSTIANGQYSTAMGSATKANGTYSTAMGIATEANGPYSTAIGGSSKANGAYSTTIGNSTIANGFSSLVVGLFNDTITTPQSSPSSSTPLFIVGNGTSTSVRSNAMVVRKDGNVAIGNISPTSKLDVDGKTKTINFQMTSGAGANKILQSDASGNASWVNPTSIVSNDSQSLSLSGNNLTISRGNTVDMSPLTTNTWRTSGNTGTNADTNFIGTTDSVDLVFKNNNNQNMRLFANGSWLLGDSMQGAGIKTFFDSEKGAFRTGKQNFSTSRNWDKDSIGTNSFAAGIDNKAKGNSSIAMGSETKAIGLSSVAMGDDTRAYGNFSIAMGSNTEANGTASVAIGANTIANEFISTAMGQNTTANGIISTAMGFNTIANGSFSAVTGNTNIANGFSSLVIGQYNDSILARQNSASSINPLFIIGNGTSSSVRRNAMVVRQDGNVGIGINAPTCNLDVNGKTKTINFQMTNTAGANRYLKSDALGNATWDSITANEVNAWGISGNTGTNATTNFIGTTDNVDLVFKNNNNQNMRLFANGTWLVGDTIQGLGSKTFFDITNGAFRTGSIVGSTPRLWDKDSLGINSFAAGLNTKAKGFTSIAMGDGSQAYGTTAIAMGVSTIANANSSIAMGQFTIANGLVSTAIGNTTRANGANATAMGNATEANASNSTSLGNSTKANGFSSLVVGQFNDTILAPQTFMTATTPLFIVGNGTSSSIRRNALVVRNDGNVAIGNISPTSKLDVDGKTKTIDFQMTNTAGVNRYLKSDALGNATWDSITVDDIYAWGLTGNSGTNPSTNFIGTTNSVDLVFKTNNNQSMRLLANGSWLVGDSIQGGGDKTFFDTYKAAFRTGNMLGTLRFWDRDSLGQYSFATGRNTMAKGDQSVAMGVLAKTHGHTSTAIGWQSEANGDISTAIGFYPRAYGDYSVAIGHDNDANGENATSMGYSSIANGFSSFVIGQYNDTIITPQTAITSNTPLFIIGNGVSHANRKNAVVVQNDGDFGINNNNPLRKLHILGDGGKSTATATTDAEFVLEEAGDDLYMSILTDTNQESGYQFGNQLNGAHAGIYYNSGANTYDMRFRVNGNSTKMTIDKDGQVGIGTTTPNSDLETTGSLATAIHTTTTSITLDENHHTVILTGGTPTVTLPAANTCTRRIYVIVNQTGGSRSISTYISFTGAASTSVFTASSITIQSDGTNWYRIQ